MTEAVANTTTGRPVGTMLLQRLLWSAGSFGAIFALKIGSTAILSRLLAPEIFGVMVIVQAIRTGIELFSDLGLEQNVVHSARGLEPPFINTVWTVQILRGLMLSAIFLALAPVLASFYDIDIGVLLVMAAAPFVNALASPSIYATIKRFEVRKRNLFELLSESLNLTINVGLALLSPTVWALVWGVVLGLAVRSVLSYALDRVPRRLMLDGRAVREIIGFGKWIMLTSLLMYFSVTLDRLYLGRVAPVYLLGIYGIARQISDLPTALSRRLSYQVLFPLLSGSGSEGRAESLQRLGAVRWKLIGLAAVGLGGFAGFADWAIRVVYDPRYAGAGAMLFALTGAAWFSVLSNLNEALVLGNGKPAFSSFANIARLLTLAIGLPLGFAHAQYFGVIAAVAAGEFAQYACMAIGQHRVGMTFHRQDLIGSAAFFWTIAVCVLVREMFGLGVPWQAWNGMP